MLLAYVCLFVSFGFGVSSIGCAAAIWITTGQNPLWVKALCRLLAIFLIAAGLLLLFPTMLFVADRLGFSVHQWPLGSPESLDTILGR